MACIRGLEAMDWGGSFFTRQESFMACFTEVLRCAGRETTYAEVMGLSGAAFKLTTGKDNWCPSEAISDVEVGEVLELMADDPSSEPDIKSWTKRTGHELISIEENDGVFRFLIRRTA